MLHFVYGGLTNLQKATWSLFWEWVYVTNIVILL